MLVIGGTHSGCGKSTVTLGLIAALKRLGHVVQPFKSGPDFIDAGLHGLLAGRASRNLDIWMCGPSHVLGCVERHTADADLAVIEGAMGFYDGADRSTAALARLLSADVVLVVDAGGMAESAAATIKGFCHYNESGALIKGVIFNRVSSRSHYERLKNALAGLSVETLGFLPRSGSYSIPSRHLGLTVAEEAPIGGGAIQKLADAVIENIGLEKIAALAAVGARARHLETSPAQGRPQNQKEKNLPQVSIAVARDKAFCFYYEDNLDMLREAGARIVFFSPIADQHLPQGVDAIYLGGGYPELSAAELSANQKMLGAVRDFAEAGRPVFAECGGFMYLGSSIRGDFDRDGERLYPLCGVFPIETALNGRPVLGYREATLAEDCILGGKGEKIRGHEFHYSRAARRGEKEGVRFNVLGEEKEGEKIKIKISSAIFGSALGSYTHFHLGSSPLAAGRVVEFIRKQKEVFLRWKP